jgi:hypothetical protein
MSEMIFTTKSDLALEQLREFRSKKLKETDWWVLKGNPTQEQLDYRQELRDIPENQTPKWNETNDDGPLNIIWPIKP